MNDYACLHAMIGSEEPAAGVRRWVRDYLTGVLAGRISVAAVHHPLGFWCFPAWRDGDNGVCIHVWVDGARASPTTSPIHAHSWDLLSVVLYGTVRNVIVDIDGTRRSHRVFEIESTAAGDLVRGTSRTVGCHVGARQRYGAGQIYTLPYGSFHVSDVRGDAATVVLGHSRQRGSDRSLGALDTTDHWVYRRRCAAPETRRIARTVLARLSEFDLPEQLEDRCERAT